MKITYWGTGAYEAIPAPFCACSICENARNQKGKEIRTRHCTTIDDLIQLDYSPDNLLQTLWYGLNVRDIRHLLITHGHYDHFDFWRLDVRRVPCASSDLPRLTVVGNPYVIEKIEHMEAFHQLKIDTIETKYYESIAIDASTVVTPLPANHAQEIGGGNLYHIARNNRQFLFAHDSGPLYEDVFRWLSGKQMDAVSLDCTGVLCDGGPTHMNIASCGNTVRRLLEDGSLKSGSIQIYSHFSHCGGATHAQLEIESKPHEWTPAFDGMSIQI